MKMIDDIAVGAVAQICPYRCRRGRITPASIAGSLPRPPPWCTTSHSIDRYLSSDLYLTSDLWLLDSSVVISCCIWCLLLLCRYDWSSGLGLSLVRDVLNPNVTVRTMQTMAKALQTPTKSGESFPLRERLSPEQSAPLTKKTPKSKTPGRAVSSSFNFVLFSEVLARISVVFLNRKFLALHC